MSSLSLRPEIEMSPFVNIVLLLIFLTVKTYIIFITDVDAGIATSDILQFLSWICTNSYFQTVQRIVRDE